MELRDRDLVLRRWRLDDVPAVVAACQDPEIPRWIPFVPSPYTPDDGETFIRGCLDCAAERIPRAIVDAHSDRVLGSIDLRLNDMKTGHVGYWVAREARGRGVATRALRTLARWGFEELDLRRLELITDPDNVASQRVAENVGFRREGVLRSHLLHRDGRRRDSVMFSLLPGELAG